MASSTQLPSIVSFLGEPRTPGQSPQDPTSLQVVSGSPVVLRWKISGAADALELTDPALPAPKRLPATVSTATVTPHRLEQDYLLVAISGVHRSPARRVHVSTHGATEFVSPHATVSGASSDLAGTLEDASGKPLCRWPFELLDRSGRVLTSAELTELGGASALPHEWGWFVTDADGRYLIRAAPAGATVHAMPSLSATTPAPAIVPSGASTSAQRPLVMQLVQRARSWNSAHSALVAQFTAAVKSACGDDPAAIMNWQRAHGVPTTGCIDAATLAAAGGDKAGLVVGVAVTEGLRAAPSWNKPVVDANGKPVQSEPGVQREGDHDIVKRDEEVVGPEITKLAARIPPGVIHDFIAGFGQGATQAPGATYRLDARIADTIGH